MGIRKLLQKLVETVIGMRVYVVVFLCGKIIQWDTFYDSRDLVELETEKRRATEGTNNGILISKSVTAQIPFIPNSR